MGSYTKKWGLFLAKQQLIQDEQYAMIDMLGSFRLPCFFIFLFSVAFYPIIFRFRPHFRASFPVYMGKSRCYTNYDEIMKERAFYEEKLSAV